MTCSPTSAKYTDKDSIKAIVEAESNIIDCMAAFFSSTNGAIDLLGSVDSLEERSQLFNQLLSSYADKENSVAYVIKASAKKLSADKGIHHNKIDCCNNNNTCSCNK